VGAGGMPFGCLEDVDALESLGADCPVSGDVLV